MGLYNVLSSSSILAGMPDAVGGAAVQGYLLCLGGCVVEGSVIVLGMWREKGGCRYYVNWVGLCINIMAIFFFELRLHLCHALLCLRSSLRIFCNCLSQRIFISEVFPGVHACSVRIFYQFGAPCFYNFFRSLYHVAYFFNS